VGDRGAVGMAAEQLAEPGERAAAVLVAVVGIVVVVVMAMTVIVVMVVVVVRLVVRVVVGAAMRMAVLVGRRMRVGVGGRVTVVVVAVTARTVLMVVVCAWPGPDLCHRRVPPSTFRRARVRLAWSRGSASGRSQLPFPSSEP